MRQLQIPQTFQTYIKGTPKKFCGDMPRIQHLQIKAEPRPARLTSYIRPRRQRLAAHLQHEVHGVFPELGDAARRHRRAEALRRELRTSHDPRGNRFGNGKWSQGRPFQGRKVNLKLLQRVLR